MGVAMDFGGLGRAWAARIIGGATVLALTVPSVSMAAEPKNGSPPAAEQTKDTADAKELFAKGKAAYETFQYERAVELFTEAYAMVPADQPGVRNAMVYNIARAQERAYDVDQDLTHLKQAILLLESWVAEFQRVYVTDTPEIKAELERTEVWLQELKGRMAAVESGKEPASSSSVQARPEVTFDPTFVTPDMRHHRKRISESNRTEGMIAAGWTLGGVGVLVALAGGSTLGAAGESAAGHIAGATGLAVGGAMLITGSALLGVGYKRRKRIREGGYAVAPAIDGNTAGVVFSGRF